MALERERERESKGSRWKQHARHKITVLCAYLLN